MADPLKAYKVTDPDEGVGGILFARFHAEARRNGAHEFGDGDWGSVDCERAKEFDEYAPGPVPALVLVEHGWWFECPWTGEVVGDCVQDDLVESADRQSVYANRWARLNDCEYHGRHRALKAVGAAAARIAFPGGEGFTGFIDGKTGQPGAGFWYPSGRRYAHWTIGSDTVSVAKMDEVAFLKWKAGGYKPAFGPAPAAPVGREVFV